MNNKTDKLKEAAILSQQRWIDSIESKSDIVKRSELRVDNIHLNKQTFKKILIIAVAACVMLMTISVVAVHRNDVIKTIHNRGNDRLSISANDHNSQANNKDGQNNNTNKSEDESLLKNTPEGFKCYETFSSVDSSINRYSNGNKYFSIYKYTNASVRADSDGYKCIYQSDKETHYRNVDGDYMLFIVHNNFLYEVYGNLSYDEMKNILKNIK